MPCHVRCRTRNSLGSRAMKWIKKSERERIKKSERESACKTAFWAPVLITLFVTGAKFLCFPLYRSTDFEVHRNWMAITHSLPIERWYYDNTSEWTLDYPPLFAWFEYALSFPASLVDEKMVDVKNLNYESDATVYFMRTSVILCDLVFALAAHSVATGIIPEMSQDAAVRPGNAAVRVRKSVLTFGLLFGDVNLFMVDHIHFQYNGLLNGLLFLSIACIIRGWPLLGAFFFATLLNFKHIYLYIAPAFFFYLFLVECFPDPARNVETKPKLTYWRKEERVTFLMWLKRFDVKKFVGLGLVVSGVFAASLGPFLAMGQAHQLKERLFPFKRGLTHAYWAPNFWALYNAADKVLAWNDQRWNPPNGTIDEIHLASIDPLAAMGKQEQHVASSTSGRVEEFEHVFLPSVTPLTTFKVTTPFILLSVIPIWNEPTWESFVESLVLCAWASFLFGWHVHEKAVLMITLPLAVLAVGNSRAAWIFCKLQFVATLSLFPLFFTPMEDVLKVLLWTVGTAIVYCAFQCIFQWGSSSHIAKNPRTKRGRVIFRLERVYLLGAVFVCAYYLVLHCFIFGDKLEFLPLMVVSTYCAIGVMWCWIKFFVLGTLGILKPWKYLRLKKSRL